MNNTPKVFVIILNYNGKDTIKNCLNSLYKSDYSNYEVVVVDNDSQDGSFEDARKFYSGAHFIKNPKNIGFSAGNNVAIRFALERLADYIFLLNNDALVEKDTISRLIKTAQKEKTIGIVSPVIFDGGGQNVWFAGGKINWLKMKTEHLFVVPAEKPYETEYATGCGMLVKKDVFREAGLFDEKYFLYYEDADFSLRARIKGFGVLVDPQAVIYHFEKSENSPENKTYWLVLSGLIFFKKNTPMFFSPWMGIYLFLRKIKNWLDVKIKKDKIILAVQKAYQDYKNLKTK